MSIGERARTSMTICIAGVKMDAESLLKHVTKPDAHAKQIVEVWCQSTLCHCFNKRSAFTKAVHRNQKVLKSPDRINALFTAENHCFSTLAKHRQETLYFVDKSKNTGRLRQQHKKGPLAKIDKQPKEHRFLSKPRKDSLRKLYDDDQVPEFHRCELRKRDGKYHVEFPSKGKGTSGWHWSKGTVRTTKKGVDRRIKSALENILGIRAANA